MTTASNHSDGTWVDRPDRRFHLVGGGVASLAAAAFLIRDGEIPGHRITIYEESGRIGGALDGAGTPEAGYVLRGGRMLESHYACTFDLFDSIPTLDMSRTVTEETLAWNRTMKTSSKSRLVRDGMRQTAPAFGLSEADILTIERLVLEPESLLGHTSIADQFPARFFRTDFWFMWCTTFAFQPWHSAVEFKRYLVRFQHMVGGFDRLQGIMRTVYNQYDSLVRPLQKWLEQRGVNFEMNSRVTDLSFSEQMDQYTVDGLTVGAGARSNWIEIQHDDLMFVTLGSMTEASTLGDMTHPPLVGRKEDGGAWTLWERIAKDRPAFGNPAAFDSHVDESRWLSFTLTMRDPLLLRIMADFTGNVPGEGGLVTFPDSPWLASIVIPYQPHFIGQPADVSVLWGYGLKVDAHGDFVRKPMADCTGTEILQEMLGQLRIGEGEAQTILQTSIAIPCLMPFITSQFLPRESGDRPAVVPKGATNFAFMGQYCELPDDVVFTVEYSIRSAAVAVYSLLHLDRAPPPVYKGGHHPRVVLSAFLALHDIGA